MVSSENKAYLYLVLALTAWGSLFIACKYVLEVLPSFTLLAIRYLIAVCVLLIFYKKQPKSKIQRKDYKFIFLIGFVGYFLSIGCQLLGTQHSTASMASLINSMCPAMIILLAAPILKEKISLRKGLAVGVTLIGTAVIIGNIGTGNTVKGIIFSFLSMSTWSLASVLLRLFCQKYDSLMVTLYGIGVGFVFALPASIIELRYTPVQLSALIAPSVILSTLYIGVVCTAGAMLLWNKALGMKDAATCSLFFPIQPLTSAVLGVLILREVLNLNFVIGSALIVGGIVYAMISDRKTKQQLNSPIIPANVEMIPIEIHQE